MVALEDSMLYIYKEPRHTSAYMVSDSMPSGRGAISSPFHCIIMFFYTLYNYLQHVIMSVECSR